MTDAGHDVILVLGANVKPDGSPSEALKRRLMLALSCWRRRPVPIICCGARGRDEPVAEGDMMRAWLIESGVPEAEAISESRSTDTLQNIAFAKRIMDEKGLSHALVVTSDYHLRRALAVCRRLGVRAEGAGSPSVKRYWLKNRLRELLAWGKFVLMRGRKPRG